MTSWQPDATLTILRQRAQVIKFIRSWFDERGVLEVETPILGDAGITDPQIHSFKLEDWYLQTSPEYFMKRLLADGSGDIYQLAKVFRAAESGWRHHHEFTLLEWYRLGIDERALAQEVVDLIQHLAGTKNLKPVITTYADCLATLGLDLFSAHGRNYRNALERAEIELVGEFSRTALRELVFTELVQKQFADDHITVVHDYPAEDASLARLSQRDPRVAARFEVFWGGLELANGFHELTDVAEQRSRFMQDNQQRRADGLEEVEVDENLLAALAAGLPDCAGVALGFDRLLMKILDTDDIREVISFRG